MQGFRLPEAASWQSLIQNFLEDEPNAPLITIIGPTAAGKTSLSIDVAHWLEEIGLPAEIVNADSRQLYKGLDIGTAKITEEEMEDVIHHLLSVLNPNEPVTIAWFQREAAKIIEDCHKRNVLPILVGGSMLYVSSIVDGLMPMKSDPKKREKLEHEYDKDAGETLQRRLMKLDPQTAAITPRENKVYVVRALEMIEETGQTKEEMMETVESPYTSLILGVDQESNVLKKRIEDRVGEMFEAGWVDEVQKLLDEGYSKDDPAMQSHGYREIVEAIEEGVDPKKKADEISKRSWQYARRHRTWWRDDPRVHWL